MLKQWLKCWDVNNYLPFSYFGVTIVGKPNHTAFWIKSMIKSKVNLQFGGAFRGSALGSMPSYFMSIFRLPVAVRKHFEKVFRNFLWKGAAANKGTPLVRWDSVRAPLSLGYMGVENLHPKNMALLSKQLWSFEKEENARWRVVTKRKFGVDFLGGLNN